MYLHRPDLTLRRGLVRGQSGWPGGALFLCSKVTTIRDRKSTPKNFCDKDFAELSGECSGAICLKTLVLMGSALKLFRKFFGAVRAILWLWGSLLGSSNNTGLKIPAPMWCKIFTQNWVGVWHPYRESTTPSSSTTG